MYKQVIIARKDLNMSPGKLAAQVSHASMAFLTNMIKKNVLNESTVEGNYLSLLKFDKNLYKQRIIYKMRSSSEK